MSPLRVRPRYERVAWLCGAVSLAVAAAAAAAPAAGAGAAAEPGAALDLAAYQKEIAAWRADRIAGLRRPDGWLSDVGRFRLDEGENRVGSDPAARVVLPAGEAPAFVGTLVRHGEAVTLVPAPGLTAALSAERHQNGDHGLLAPAPPGGVFTGPLALAIDDSEKGPMVVHLGSLSIYVIKRFDNLIARVKDAKAPAIAAFKGIDDFPVRADWRLEARWETYKAPKPVTITNVLGEAEQVPPSGAVVFERGGRTYRLDAFEESGGRLFVIFGDRTNGFETYGGGRFIDTDAPKDGRVVIDFNQAYNPPCALSTFAVCPLPPPQNRLPLEVAAGEKTYRHSE